MERRAFLLAGVGLVTSPAMVGAQSSRPRRRIGYLHAASLGPENTSLSVLRPLWAQAGYVEGDTVILRSADGDLSRLPVLVDEFLAQNVAVMIVVGPQALRAAAARTKTVPIVALDLETDPVRAGYARTLSRPGGNVTGVFLDQPSLAGKWIDLLREVAPRTEEVALAWDPSTDRAQLELAVAAARERGLRSTIIEWRAVEDFDRSFAPLAGRNASLLVVTAPGFSRVAREFGTAALRHRLPSIAPLKGYVGHGILMSYGPSLKLLYARAMNLVQRIVDGASPEALSIELPSHFEFVVDLRAARSLGISVPGTLQAMADDLID